MEFLVWLENTWIANEIRTVPWLYPTFETGHYIGLSLLVGGIMLIDLRVLGFARALPLSRSKKCDASTTSGEISTMSAREMGWTSAEASVTPLPSPMINTSRGFG